MARLKIRQNCELDKGTVKVLENYERSSGINHTVYRVIAAKPELLKSFMNYTASIRTNSTLDAGLEELLMYFVSNINRCDY
ncbi:MAG: hypothetical protein ACK5K7_01890 [Bacilli bacterium]